MSPVGKMLSLTLLIMITQELKKHVPNLVERIQDYRHRRQQQVQQPILLTGKSYSSSLEKWTKLTYSRWIEDVKLKFKKGDIVTLREIASVPGVVPFLYKIVEIQEIHYLAQLDSRKQIPRAIGCVIPGAVISMDTVFWKTPDELRFVSPMESLKNADNTTTETQQSPDEWESSERLRLAYLGE